MRSLRSRCSAERIKQAVKIIKNGGIVIFPTDTVYGIGCDPYNEKAVETIYKIKKRDRKKLLPILGFSKKIISHIAEFDKKSSIVAEYFWPGPITIILELKDKRLKKTLKVKEKVAVRVPSNQCTLKILEKCKFLVGTSANISQRKPITDSAELYDNEIKYDILIDDGKIPTEGESTIIEFLGEELKIHRNGVISKEEILKAL